MPKISSYPSTALTIGDEIVLNRAGKNYKAPPKGLVFVTPINMVDTLGTTWNVYAAPVGTYNFNLQDGNHNLPAGIGGILLYMTSRWAAASNTSFCRMYPKGATANFLVARALVSNFFLDMQGIVPVGTDDDVTVQVSGAASTGVILTLLGYYL